MLVFFSPIFHVKSSIFCSRPNGPTPPSHAALPAPHHSHRSAGGVVAGRVGLQGNHWNLRARRGHGQNMAFVVWSCIPEWKSVQWNNINPYQWSDDPPATWAIYPSFDGILRERSRSTNAPSRVKGGTRCQKGSPRMKERVDHETVQHGSSQAQLQAVDTRPRQALCKKRVVSKGGQRQAKQPQIWEIFIGPRAASR